ncbi:hypothetical protein K491DRAFT_687173 [Lophiostoma macrostomum CBS 122681]|uniref:Uncharacterized protein n=1 Tax=Lophiostoma macrostomum CBS 122681 TaxID=1314788 RepID=A0A6A6TNY9_9PLEO|nr:hypothetical protein K491DRAFT_687173 [Lophiostoma macrostomum CBS 122681]
MRDLSTLGVDRSYPPELLLTNKNRQCQKNWTVAKLGSRTDRHRTQVTQDVCNHEERHLYSESAVKKRSRAVASFC